MRKEYLVILGDVDNRHYKSMLERLKKVGKATQLIDNIFVLTIEGRNDFGNMELVRNYIAGQEYGYCLIITINSNFSCAWNLSKDRSEFLDNIIKEQRNEEK